MTDPTCPEAPFAILPSGLIVLNFCFDVNLSLRFSEDGFTPLAACDPARIKALNLVSVKHSWPDEDGDGIESEEVIEVNQTVLQELIDASRPFADIVLVPTDVLWTLHRHEEHGKIRGEYLTKLRSPLRDADGHVSTHRFITRVA